MGEVLLNKDGSLKPNCFNCAHLEWGFGDIGDPEGFVCNKRIYKTNKQEDDHLNLLSDNRYLNTTKSCCEIEELKEGQLPHIKETKND